jgi:hypothetical protein
MDLQELSDRAEIAAVLTRYTLAIDTDEWDRLDDVFTPDAELDYTEGGGPAASFPEAKKWLVEMLPAFSTKRMHTLGQISVEFNGARDEAEVVAYFHNPMLIHDGKGGKPFPIELGGFYRHSFVRTADGWRSRRLKESTVWTKGL